MSTTLISNTMLIPFIFYRFCRCCGETCGQWQRRWLVVKDSYIAYVRPKDGRLHCVMLFDAEFEVSSAMSDVSHGLVVANLSRLAHFIITIV